jgi:hypothetical protein
MAKKANLEHLDAAMESANLKEDVKTTKKKSTKRKVKTIQILVDWEEKIKEHHVGTVTSYITSAIQEKMQRDNLL